MNKDQYPLVDILLLHDANHSGITVVLLFVGWLMYRIAMPHLISRMSA